MAVSPAPDLELAPRTLVLDPEQRTAPLEAQRQAMDRKPEPLAADLEQEPRAEILDPEPRTAPVRR
jgi:hypothetical protein